MPAPRLANLIRHMVNRSTQTGKVERCDLANGLRVSVWVKPERTVLYLSRAKNYPSAGEWAVVTSNWPTPIDKAEFERHKANGRYYLVGQLLAAPAVSETAVEAGHA